jgi:hypothetical protein
MLAEPVEVDEGTAHRQPAWRQRRPRRIPTPIATNIRLCRAECGNAEQRRGFGRELVLTAPTDARHG